MNRSERARELVEISKSKHRLGFKTIVSRLARGWTEDRILDTPTNKLHRPPMSHPYKRGAYIRTAGQRKRDR